MTQQFVLPEYGTVEIALSEVGVRTLSSAFANRVGISVGSRPGTYLVTADRWVGTIVTDEVELLIRPKVPLHNLFLLLGVGLPPGGWRPETLSWETEPHLLAALADLFSRTVGHATANGVLRSYRDERARMPALRGRIDFPAQLRSPALVAPIACEFSEHTADIVENRLLKAATRRLFRVRGVPPRVHARLVHQLARFEEVDDDWVNPDMVDRLAFTRLNRHYEPALRLARLILRDVTLLDRPGEQRASGLLVDMADLYQRFLADRLHRHLFGRLTVREEPVVHLGWHRRVPMEPDLVFYSGHDPVYVGDAKYKLADAGIGRSSDYYQLLAYLTALDLDEGILVYCQSTGEAPEREVVVRHAAKRLTTYPLDLSGSPAALEGRVKLLAERILNHSGAQQKSAS